MTNKHVIKNKSSVELYLHERNEVSSSPEPSGQSIVITVKDLPSFCIEHPDEDIDLAAIFFDPIREQIKLELNKQVFRVTIDNTFIKTDDELNDISDVADEIIMTGYPIGLWDEQSNLPIIRKGITASPPAIKSYPKK